MGFHSLKIFLITMLAVIFGGMQFLCVCESASIMQSQIHDSVEHSHQTLDIADNLQVRHESHEHPGDCENCDTRALAASKIDVSNLASAKLDPSEAHPISLKSDNRFNLLARSDLSGRRWLDPPRQTPVSLKTRLLT